MAEMNVIFSDDRGEFLEHYGVPGMKWGKWNSETMRKYAGSSTGRYAGRRGMMISNRAGRVGKKTAKAIASGNEKRARKKAEEMAVTQAEVMARAVRKKQKEARKQGKEYNLTKEEKQAVAINKGREAVNKGYLIGHVIAGIPGGVIGYQVAKKTSNAYKDAEVYRKKYAEANYKEAERLAKKGKQAIDTYFKN